MSANNPVIKFSPFEALLIGEKNKVLKRQPMKNTIFVRRVNQPSKIINLRDLFGLEDNAKKSESSEAVFKMPQRVRDFLRIRRLKNKNMKPPVEKKKDVLFYEFEGRKMIFRNDEIVKQKKAKIKSNKVKFKNSNKENLGRKFNSQSKMKNSYHSRLKRVLPRVVLKTKKPTNLGNKHLLRGKDGKFISKKEYELLKLNKIRPKQKYLGEISLNKKKQVLNCYGCQEIGNLYDCESREKIVGWPPDNIRKYDVYETEGDLNLFSDKFYENNSLEDFEFPDFPGTSETLDFDDDNYLSNLIYENFPEIVKFDCNEKFEDFSDALKDSEIIKADKSLKMYEKKTNVKSSSVRLLLDNRISCIKFHSSYHSLKNRYKSDIDEPLNKNNHLITGKSIGSLFFRSVEGKDIFIGDLVKPYFQNSWFGSLPEV